MVEEKPRALEIANLLDALNAERCSKPGGQSPPSLHHTLSLPIWVRTPALEATSWVTVWKACHARSLDADLYL